MKRRGSERVVFLPRHHVSLGFPESPVSMKDEGSPNRKPCVHVCGRARIIPHGFQSLGPGAPPNLRLPPFSSLLPVAEIFLMTSHQFHGKQTRAMVFIEFSEVKG